ncbi:RIKEN cDNA 1110048D14 [Mus musculus]|uniref:Uncharacterized protein n=1 Tax=Mus musculus TaxID=10090 RepID=Q8BMZ2_MOUSE|nr:RIKEN cDNA 1110048D14 [Mus musculus]BAC25070.1 unnamed protein product [Mus musculus]
MYLLMVGTIFNVYRQKYYRVFKYVNICSTAFKLKTDMIFFICQDTLVNFCYILFSSFLLVLFL